MKGDIDMTEYVTAIFETLGTIAEGFGSLVADLFQSAVNLLWTPGTEGTGGSLTVVGVFMLIGVSVGLFMWAFRYIKGLVRINPSK